jgi:hypothetical protein
MNSEQVKALAVTIAGTDDPVELVPVLVALLSTTIACWREDVSGGYVRRKPPAPVDLDIKGNGAVL